MNRSAIHDLLGSIVCSWYQSAANWTPPGELDSHTCGYCRWSILSSVLDISEWPHELMHALSLAVDEAAADILLSLNDHDAFESSEPIDSTAGHVAEALGTHLADIVDVLTECVKPRLDAWIDAEVARSLGG